MLELIDQSRLFIIIGLPRSGTSLLQEIMNCFDGFCNTRESRIRGSDGRSCYGDVIDKGSFGYLDAFILINWTGEYFVEKMPASIYCLPQLQTHFPDANYLFLERHPRNAHLSMMNMHVRRKDEQEYKSNHLSIGDEMLDPSLPMEVFVAKELLEMVKRQVRHKPFFKNQLTLRYETITTDLEQGIKATEHRFKIKCNYDKARGRLAKRSYSSKNNLYNINEITDQRARSAVNSACNLWGYETI